MSKPRYDWWGYVKGMIRRYPQLAEQYNALHSQIVTASYSGVPGNSGAGRSVETLVIRELPGTKQREYEAVRRAIETTERMRTGAQRLRIIRLVLFEGSHTLQGAALTLPISYDQARMYHREFIYLVARYYGLMDGE